MECKLSTLRPLTWTQYHALSMENYFPRTLRERKKDELRTLEQGIMYVGTYESNFSVLSRYALKLVTTEEEKNRLFVNGLNFELHLLYVHMTSVENSFNEATYFVKKTEGGEEKVRLRHWLKNIKTHETFRAPILEVKVVQHLHLGQSSLLCLPLQVIARVINIRI